MPMLEQHEVAGYLLKRRLIGRRSIVAGSLRIGDASSRNRNVRVSDGATGESYLVKQGVVADSAHTLANEAALYRRLSAGPAALRACVPRLHGYDRARGVLILEWIERGEDLERLVASRGGCPPALAAALGRALAALHAVAPDAEELRRDAPWVLALHRPPLEALRYFSEASVELVKRLQADAPLCRALDELREGWAPLALVHRDVKWANCIAHPAPGAASSRLTRVKLVDWEMAGWGDPAFDVGSAFSDCVAGSRAGGGRAVVGLRPRRAARRGRRGRAAHAGRALRRRAPRAERLRVQPGGDGPQRPRGGLAGGGPRARAGARGGARVAPGAGGVTAIAPAGAYEAQVLALLEAVDVRPPDTLLWFGRRDAATAPAPRSWTGWPTASSASSSARADRCRPAGGRSPRPTTAASSCGRSRRPTAGAARGRRAGGSAGPTRTGSASCDPTG